jgi:hypothetical protein
MRLSNCLVISLLQIVFRASLNCSLSFLHLRLFLLFKWSLCSMASLEKLFSDDYSIRELSLSYSLYFSLMSPSSSKVDDRMCYGDLVRFGET